MRFFSSVLLCLIVLFSDCQKPNTPLVRSGHSILVTNSTFESAAREFMGPEELEITRLCEPGTCPGHFDIQPSQAFLIQQSPFLIRFEFQSSLDSKIRALSGPQQKKIKVIANEEGLCKPESYLRICKAMS